MWDRKNFEKRMNAEGIEFRFWGKYGKEVAEDLEQQLHFNFDKETRY